MEKRKKENHRTLLTAVIVALVVQVTSTVPISAQSEEPESSGYITANGIDYYYEIHGEGDLSTEASAQAEPLLLLHGGLGSIDMFEPVLPILTENRQVIGVDLHGHGRTELGDRPISYVDMGNDMAILLKELGYNQVDVVGYSLGGGLKDARWMREHMSQNRLAILPNLTHYDIFLAPELAQTVHRFLSGENNFRNWNEQVQSDQN